MKKVVDIFETWFVFFSMFWVVISIYLGLKYPVLFYLMTPFKEYVSSSILIAMIFPYSIFFYIAVYCIIGGFVISILEKRNHKKFLSIF
jgi:hypothetical protein